MLWRIFFVVTLAAALALVPAPPTASAAPVRGGIDIPWPCWISGCPVVQGLTANLKGCRLVIGGGRGSLVATYAVIEAESGKELTTNQKVVMYLSSKKHVTAFDLVIAYGAITLTMKVGTNDPATKVAEVTAGQQLKPTPQPRPTAAPTCAVPSLVTRATAHVLSGHTQQEFDTAISLIRQGYQLWYSKNGGVVYAAFWSNGANGAGLHGWQVFKRVGGQWVHESTYLRPSPGWPFNQAKSTRMPPGCK